ncbi:MAG: hypothetical protein H0V97_04215 [Actinobacteria bacterium]|nr:hypothetical protein [Actinomycetota bacterium]
MSTKTGRRPPHQLMIDKSGGEPWMLLATLDKKSEMRRLIDRLIENQIETKVIRGTLATGGAMVMVRRTSLEDARFLFAMISFEGTSTERRGRSRRAIWGSLAAALMLAMAGFALAWDALGAF